MNKQYNPVVFDRIVFLLERVAKQDILPQEKNAVRYAAGVMKSINELQEEMYLEYSKTYSLQELLIIREALETQIDEEWLDYRVRMFTEVRDKVKEDIKNRLKGE